MSTSVATPTRETPRTIAVTRYTYHLFSSRTADDVVIYLYDAEANVVGQVFFVADDEPLPPAAQNREITALYFPRSCFALVIDLLRNEGPIEIRWAGPFDTSLSTAFEPIGEGEKIA